jgi:hypothetical protein
MVLGENSPNQKLSQESNCIIHITTNETSRSIIQKMAHDILCRQNV